jgi:hypothetical protein
MKHTRTGVRFFTALLALCTLGAGLGEAVAQAYPNRPIRMVVAGSTGGGTDFSVRVLAQNWCCGLIVSYCLLLIFKYCCVA